MLQELILSSLGDVRFFSSEFCSDFNQSYVFPRLFFELISMVGRTEVVILPLIESYDLFFPTLVELLVTDGTLIHVNSVNGFANRYQEDSPCNYKVSVTIGHYMRLLNARISMNESSDTAGYSSPVLPELWYVIHATTREVSWNGRCPYCGN